MADAPGQELLDKLKLAGTPLKEYLNGKVYSGIKTGYNAAFIIDGATRERLIAQDSRSVEVIKPYLVGRDIKHYSPLSTSKYLVLIPSGWTRRQMGWQQLKKSGQLVPPAAAVFATAWDALASNYPAIAEYLLPFEKAASARSDMGNYWWELRSCDYYNDYERPKIIFPDIASRNQFTIDREGFYLDMTAFFIPLEDKYLLGILNSKAVQYFFCNISPVIRSGFLRWKRQYIEQIPIPKPTTTQEAELVRIVDDILTSRSKDAGAKTATAEAAVDELVFQLYGLTEEESDLVRDKVAAFAAAPFAT